MREEEDEIDALRRRLQEADDTLAAIRSGDVDALIVHGAQGERIFAMRTNDTTYRLLVETMNEGALWLDLNGRIVYANERFAAMTRKRSPELTGHPFEEFLSPTDRGRFRRSLAAGAEAARDEFRLAIGPDQTVPVLVSVRLLESADEKGHAVVVTDLAAQKKAEATLQRQAFDLERANKELESFNYSVSHDLRTPLFVMRGALSVLLDDPTPARIAQFAPELAAASRRLNETVESLLSLSRLSRAEVVRSDVDLSKIAQEAVAALVAGQTDRVRLEIQPGLRADADPALTRIVLENLISNALKFSRDQPHAYVRVGLAMTPRGAAFFVRDNGVGFDITQAKRLFEPFQRLHNAHDFEGNGIGLATVARIVRRHHGEVWSESTPGRGATFFFTLAPQAESASSAQPEPERPASMRASKAGQMRPTTLTPETVK